MGLPGPAGPVGPPGEDGDKVRGAGTLFCPRMTRSTARGCPGTPAPTARWVPVRDFREAHNSAVVGEAAGTRGALGDASACVGCRVPGPSLPAPDAAPRCWAWGCGHEVLLGICFPMSPLASSRLPSPRAFSLLRDSCGSWCLGPRAAGTVGFSSSSDPRICDLLLTCPLCAGDTASRGGARPRAADARGVSTHPGAQ